jgi:PTH1 family peptidyl-tRNA hydrolase
MKLVIGLGNPEQQYDGTRHNAGFQAVTKYALEKGVTFQPKDKFKARIAELTANGQKIILALPTTYYNLSGEAARAISDFYKIPSPDILVVHDELALPFGTVRTRIGGSDAGNNGVKNINAHMDQDTARIRIGIANELRTTNPDVDIVLGKFSAEESKKLQEIQEHIDTDIDAFISGNFEATTHSH